MQGRSISPQYGDDLENQGTFFSIAHLFVQEGQRNFLFSSLSTTLQFGQTNKISEFITHSLKSAYLLDNEADSWSLHRVHSWALSSQTEAPGSLQDF
jgi:hypothetical protein